MKFILLRCLAIGLAFVNSLIIKEVLGHEALGLFAYTITSGMFIAELFKLGIDQYAIKIIIKNNSNFILWPFILLGFIFTLLIYYVLPDYRLVSFLSLALFFNKLMYISNIARGLRKWALIIRDSLIQVLFFCVFLVQYFFMRTVDLNSTVLIVSALAVAYSLFNISMRGGSYTKHRLSFTSVMYNGLPQYISSVSISLYSFLFVTKFSGNLLLLGVFYIVYRVVSLINVIYQLEISDKTKSIIISLSESNSSENLRHSIVKSNVISFLLYLFSLPVGLFLLSVIYEFSILEFYFLLSPLAYFFVVALTGPINIYLSFFNLNKLTAVVSSLAIALMLLAFYIPMGPVEFSIVTIFILSVERFLKYVVQKPYNN